MSTDLVRPGDDPDAGLPPLMRDVAAGLTLMAHLPRPADEPRVVELEARLPDGTWLRGRAWY